MKYYIAEYVVEVAQLLEYSFSRTEQRYEETFSNVIVTVRRLKSDLTYSEIENILVKVKPILENAKQTKKANKSELNYFSGNMVGHRPFDTKYKQIFSQDFTLSIMTNFLDDFIEDLRMADSEGEKRDIEFSLRNLEVFLRDYLSFEEDKFLNEELVEIFKNIIEAR